MYIEFHGLAVSLGQLGQCLKPPSGCEVLRNCNMYIEFYGPVFPLGQLDQCLKPPSGRGASKFWKRMASMEKKYGKEGGCREKKKKKDSNETPKNGYILLTKEERRKFFGLNKINYPKNNIINL